MSNYLLELTAVHIALMLGYWFFLRKERQYSTLRFYLLATTLLALVIPLLKLPKLFGSSKPIDVAPTAAIQLEGVTIAPAADETIWNSDLLIWGYLAITIFFLLKLVGLSLIHI